jgi:hypothetical protein
MQGHWAVRWSGSKVITAGDPTFSKRLPDEHDTRSAFPSHLSKVDFGAFVRECVEKNSTGFLARVVREACLRVQGNLETAVEFPTASPSTGALSGSLAPA